MYVVTVRYMQNYVTYTATVVNTPPVNYVYIYADGTYDQAEIESEDYDLFMPSTPIEEIF
jgi:hypothetical protein